MDFFNRYFSFKLEYFLINNPKRLFSISISISGQMIKYSFFEYLFTFEKYKTINKRLQISKIYTYLLQKKTTLNFNN